jgi:hypothetical protein
VIVWDGEDELERARRRAPVRGWRAISPYAGFALLIGVVLFLVFVVQN